MKHSFQEATPVAMWQESADAFQHLLHLLFSCVSGL
jgi:hypothetical protein